MFPIGGLGDLGGWIVPPLPKAKTARGRRRLLQEMDPVARLFPRETYGTIWRDPLGHNWSYGVEKSQLFSKKAIEKMRKKLHKDIKKSEKELLDLARKIQAVAQGQPGVTVAPHDIFSFFAQNYVLKGEEPTPEAAAAAGEAFDKELKAMHLAVYQFIAELGLLWFTHYNGKQMLWHLGSIFAATHAAKLAEQDGSGCSVGNYANYGAFLDRFFRKGQRWLSVAGFSAGLAAFSEGGDLYQWAQQDPGDMVGHKYHQVGFLTGGLLSRYFLK